MATATSSTQPDPVGAPSPEDGFPSATAWRVRAIIPCYNRGLDLDLLLHDLARLRLGAPGEIGLTVTVIDNASEPPLHPDAPPVLKMELVRQNQNLGGSGGFNAGLARALAASDPHHAGELIWLLDSDVRVEPGALITLVRALGAHPDLVAVGSALVDPATGEVFEVGGRIGRRTGEMEQPLPPALADLIDPDREGEPPHTVRVEYLAACSLLVRRWAVEAAGLMPNVFLNGDDAAWCLRLARATGLSIAAVPASHVRHPRPDRMRTWQRYYAARNTFTVLEDAELGPAVRFRRAAREVGRALTMSLTGRDDLAELHLRGLADAAAGVRTGPAPAPLRFEPYRALADLPAALIEAGIDPGMHPRVEVRLAEERFARTVLDALRTAGFKPGSADAHAGAHPLAALAKGLLLRPRADAAVVSARATRPADWLAGRVLVTVAPEGFVLRRIGRTERARAVLSVLLRGADLSLRLAARGPGGAVPAERVPAVEGSVTHAATLSVVILSYNRWIALERTLRELAVSLRGAEVVVVDNASTDGTPTRLAAQFPEVRVLSLHENRGVAGYNAGVALARGDLVLILDDDSWPDPAALEGAVSVLAARPDLAAVALHPRHPKTQASEWRFAEGLPPQDRWPLMGCGNLVRRDDWLRAGGYEGRFFLYRNDADLAMKLLAMGRGVHFDPAWTVWHDSPAAAKKSQRWFELATRNWIWMARRHGRGASGIAGLLAGWAWAHRLAGPQLSAHRAVLRGACAGVFKSPPPLPPGVRPTGESFREILSLRRRGRSAGPAISLLRFSQRHDQA